MNQGYEIIFASEDISDDFVLDSAISKLEISKDSEKSPPKISYWESIITLPIIGQSMRKTK